jgi:hypothetical protein
MVFTRLGQPLPTHPWHLLGIHHDGGLHEALRLRHAWHLRGAAQLQAPAVRLAQRCQDALRRLRGSRGARGDPGGDGGDPGKNKTGKNGGNRGFSWIFG